MEFSFIQAWHHLHAQDLAADFSFQEISPIFFFFFFFGGTRCGEFLKTTIISQKAFLFLHNAAPKKSVNFDRQIVSKIISINLYIYIYMHI